MNISEEMQLAQKIENKQKRYVPGKWIVSLVCLLLIVGAGVFANHRQTLSAGSIAVTGLEPFRPNAVGQVQDIEKIAKGIEKLATQPSIWPVSGEVTSGFGWRSSPWDGGSEMHEGIDIANSLETPIVATADGQVVKSEWAGGYGNVVQINHGNGIETLYGHNSRLVVQAGQRVRKGQVIAYLGSTGKSTGPHAHYEVRVNGTAVDPTRFLVL